MKRLLPLLIIALAFSSCQEDVKFNNPGFQGLKDDVFWRANDARAYVSPTNTLRIEALTEYETVTLTTSNANPGTYVLGTTNVYNTASYTSNFNGVELAYATAPVTGPVSSVAVINGGTGYTSDCELQPAPNPNNLYSCSYSHDTTGGSGSGLKVAIIENAGVVTSVIRVTSQGNGYAPGDIVTVALGNVNCKLQILNTVSSNGEIEITKYDNVNKTISGKFKFNAANSNGSPLGEPILNFQYGEFYKIPVLPSM